ncbi:hypothetical protein GCM10022214_04220 [Actinomadura miaoliensis]|uniref:Uncharacterized protein n=1 Tax=Actinomadura miaoliensis TaxID=430685 RepID=A0ABP7UZK0_9ACTN
MLNDLTSGHPPPAPAADLIGTRFPTLRFAVPAAEVPLRTGPSQICGVRSLRVTWDRG